MARFYSKFPGFHMVFRSQVYIFYVFQKNITYHHLSNINLHFYFNKEGKIQHYSGLQIQTAKYQRNSLSHSTWLLNVILGELNLHM